MYLLAGLAAFAAAALLYQLAGAAADRRRFPPLGRMVDIGGRRLHLTDAGAGGPTVIFESGIAASCLNWTRIQAGVAGFTRACSYDRGWLGWSDAAGTARVTGQLVEELHALLAAAQIPAPYVFAAHSFGGLLASAYAARYPEHVAGLVLVDPLPAGEWLQPSEAQWRRLRRAVRLARRGAMLARWGVVRFSLTLLLSGARLLPRLVAKWSGGQEESVLSRLVTEVRKMPLETWPIVRAHWSQAKSFLGMAAYLESLPASSREASEAGGVPEQIPLTILSAANSTAAQIGEREAAARRSAHGKHVVTKHGHWIHLDDPELVIGEIREMVELVR